MSTKTILIVGLVFVALFVIAGMIGSTNDGPPVCSRSDAWMYAKQAVEGVLKNPDEADFHNPLGWEVENDERVSGQYIVHGQVTATNSFNAKLKQDFSAVVRCEAGTWYLGRVVIE